MVSVYINLDKEKHSVADPKLKVISVNSRVPGSRNESEESDDVTHPGPLIQDFQATGENFEPNSLLVFPLFPCCCLEPLKQTNRVMVLSSLII